MVRNSVPTWSLRWHALDGSPTNVRMLFRKIAIRVFLPVFWRSSRRRTAAGLQRFAVTELDSAWQILHVLEHARDPVLRGKAFQHAMEELHHSVEFDRVSRQVLPELPPRPLPEREPLFEAECGSDALMDFMAYAHVGEVDVFDQFDSYAAGIGPGDARKVFQEAKADEEGHAGLTIAIMKGAGLAESDIRKRVFKVRLSRAWGAWLRFSKNLGDVNLSVVLTLLYVVFGGLLAWPCRWRIAQSYALANPHLAGV